jgi:hypothetical protein
MTQQDFSSCLSAFTLVFSTGRKRRKALKIMQLRGFVFPKYPHWGRLFQHLTSAVDVREKFRKLFPTFLHNRRFSTFIHTKLTAFLRDLLNFFNKL